MNEQFLTIRVNDELTLDAGILQTEQDEIVTYLPPSITTFAQIMVYLDSKPDVLPSKDEATCLTKLCLRWSSIFATLTDPNLLPWEYTNVGSVAMLDSWEEDLIGVEIATSLAILMKMSSNNEERYLQILAKAGHYLPGLANIIRLDPSIPSLQLDTSLPNPFSKLITAGGDLYHHTTIEQLLSLAVEAHRGPCQALADRIARLAWTVGPAKGMRCGHRKGFPLNRRRLNIANESRLLQFTMTRLVQGMDFFRELSIKAKNRNLPFTDAVSLALCLPEMTTGVRPQSVNDKLKTL